LRKKAAVKRRYCTGAMFYWQEATIFFIFFIFSTADRKYGRSNWPPRRLA
jgi:hypothetical protein